MSEKQEPTPHFRRLAPEETHERRIATLEREVAELKDTVEQLAKYGPELDIEELTTSVREIIKKKAYSG